MLKSINVHKYTIIDKLSLSFSDGLTVITGETGTGKSIIIDSLGFSLGEKKRKGAKKNTFVESYFKKISLSKYGIKGKSILLRADVKERIRYYLNDSPIPQRTINEIGKDIVDMVGGHSHQSFFSPNVQLELIDNFAGIKSEVESFSKLYKRLCELTERFESLKKEIEETKRTEEFMRWELESIERLNPQKGEDDELEGRLKVLENAEKILQITNESQGILTGDGGIEEGLTRVSKLLNELTSIDSSNVSLVKELDNIYYELKDLISSLLSYVDRISLDPEEIEKTRLRVMELKDLKKRFGGSLESVIKKRDELKKRIQGLSVNSEEMDRMEKEIGDLKQEVEKRAELLSKKRKDVINEFKNLTIDEFLDLGLEKARFDVKIEDVDMRETGKDAVEFLFSANPGHEMGPLSSIASRGELSRCMLALKKVLAEVDKIPTLIFDEIDIGVSGRIADKVGDKLKELSKRHQVICITHLPQIAAKGDTHLRVEKILSSGKTDVNVKELHGKDREEEIASLIAGKKVTDSARRHARALLKQAADYTD
ncbi:DNA repair protein RecN [candidate division WOR-3 bacterium]|nr:DNA repair protein RecN [candidate division WOR-3 bacterium]